MCTLCLGGMHQMVLKLVDLLLSLSVRACIVYATQRKCTRS